MPPRQRGDCRIEQRWQDPQGNWEAIGLLSHATSTDGLKRIACKVWRGVTPEYLDNLYQSMPRRMQAVIAAKGGHTKYG